MAAESETREDVLRKSVVSLAHGQEFDGVLICRLQSQLVHLQEENERLREALAASTRNACPYRLAVLHVGQKDIEYHECKMVVGHAGFHRAFVEGTERYF